MKSLSKTLKKIHAPGWLCIVLALVFLLRIPSYFEPYSYGDEMIYLTLGNAIRQGVALYSQVHDNKPPLLYLMAALAGNLFWYKVLLSFWSMATTILFWKLTSFLFPKNFLLQKTSVWTFAVLATLPLFEGNVVNAEVFMIGFTILAFYLMLKYKNNLKATLFSGFLIGIGALFKIPAAFDLPAIVIFWVIATKIDQKNFISLLKKTLVLSSGFILPIFFTFAWYLTKGSLTDYLAAAFGQNIGYLSSFRPGEAQEPFLTRNLPLIIRAAVVAGAIGALFVFRKKLSKNFILTSVWLCFTLFAVTLSERPYPHYLIQSIAPVSIFVGMLVAKKDIEQALSIIPLGLFIFVPFYFKFWYYPTYPYYQRFAAFALGKMKKEEYLASFNPDLPVLYETSRFIAETSLPKDRIFVWGDSSIIYALSRRLPPIKYVAGYHINDFSSKEEVASSLAKSKPAYIVILPDSEHFPELYTTIADKYMLIKEIGGVQIWKLFRQ